MNETKVIQVASKFNMLSSGGASMLELFCFLIWILVTRVCLVCSHIVGCSLMIYALFFTYVVINGFTVRDLKKEEQFLKVFRMQVLGLTD